VPLPVIASAARVAPEHLVGGPRLPVPPPVLAASSFHQGTWTRG